MDNQQKPSLELITFKLGELKSAVDTGFQQVNQRFNQIDERVRHLEDWRISEQAVKQITRRPRANVTTVAVAVLALLGVVATLLAVLHK
jgi:hypothetical protein